MRKFGIVLMLILPVGAVLAFAAGATGNDGLSKFAVKVTMIGLPALVLGAIVFLTSKK